MRSKMISTGFSKHMIQLIACCACFISLFQNVSAQETDSSIELLAPLGGEQFAVGQTLTINWVIHNNAQPGGGLAVGISPNEGLNWVVIVSGTIDNGDTAYYKDSVGTFKWVIPDSIKLFGRTYAKVLGDKCQIMVGAPYDGVFAPSYSANFTVTAVNAIKQKLIQAQEKYSAIHHLPGIGQMFTLDGRLVQNQDIGSINLKTRIGLRILLLDDELSAR